MDDRTSLLAGAASLQRQVDYTGRTIGPLRLARSMAINIVGGSCIMAAVAVLWPTAVLSIIFLREHLGASRTLIGLNWTLLQMGTIAALPGAWLFSRLRRRREIWLVLTAGARMFMFGPVIVALLAERTELHATLIWVFMLSLVLVQAGSVFTSSGWWSWMSDLIPEAIRGAFFGRRFRWMLLAQSVMALVAALLLDRASSPQSAWLMFAGIFGLAAVLAVLDPLLFWLVPEPVRPAPPRRSIRELARDYLEPIRDRGYRRFLIGSGAYGLFYNLPLVFIVLFLRGEDLGGTWVGGRATLSFLSLVTVASMAANALAADAWGKLADRIGHRAVWILCGLTYFTHVVFFFVNEHNYAWLALGNAIVFGMLWSGYQVAAQNLALSMAPPNRPEFHVAVFQTFQALVTALGPVLGGWIADRWRVFEDVILPSGQPVCYIHVLIGTAFVGILATALVMVSVPDAKGTSVWPWVGRLLTGDLLRTVWNISVLGAPSSATRRVRALRRISQRDGNVLLPEIAAALDDSDVAVRREALLALGRLGTGEALDLLRWYLHEPDPALRAPSLEAIAQARIPDREQLLKRALHDPDARVRKTAAEVLGRSGATDAGQDLRALLTDERDGEVLISAAVALSRLKEFGAVREMLNLALHSADTTVRSQILLALADLLGGTSDFQQLWRKDRHWRGSGFAKLTRKLRRQARVLAKIAPRGMPRTRAERRALVGEIRSQVESFLEQVQTDDWAAALRSLQCLAFQFLVLRYHYHGDQARALEFVTAVAPEHAPRYWLVDYLRRTCEQRLAPEAPWDGLTLLALHVLVHGEPAG